MFMLRDKIAIWALSFTFFFFFFFGGSGMHEDYLGLVKLDAEAKLK